MTEQQVLVVLAVLAAFGLLALYAHARHAARRAAQRIGGVGQATGNVLRTLVVATVCAGIEWVTATHIRDWRLLVVLAVPALLAGIALTRRHGHPVSRGWRR